MKAIAAVLILALLTGCATKEDREKWAIVAAVVAIGAVAYSAARHGASAAPVTSDYEWDWDEFYNQGQLVWACRGVQTGRFADESHCAYKLKTDYRWPQK